MSTGSNEWASVAQAYEGNKANQAAYNAQNQATVASILEQQRQYNQNRKDIMPYMKTGYAANTQLGNLQGFNGAENQQSAVNAFRQDPGYQFAFGQGLQAMDRSAAARGGLMGNGNYATALQNYGQGMADQQYGNYYDRLFNLANLGRGTTVYGTQMGTNYANTLSNLYGGYGQNAANYALGNAQNIGNMAGTIGAGAQNTSDKVVNTASSLFGSYLGAGKKNSFA